MPSDYTITISLFSFIITLQLNPNTTIFELLSFLQETYQKEFLASNSKNLKLYFKLKHQFLNDGEATLQSILGQINKCFFELKEQISEISSNNSSEFGCSKSKPQQVQPQKQNQKFQQNQYPPTFNLILKYENRQFSIVVDSSLQLDELSVLFFDKFEIDGQIEMYCGMIKLSQIHHELTLIQAGVQNNSIIECVKIIEQQPNMRVEPINQQYNQNVNQQQIQNVQPLNPIQPYEIDIKFDITEGAQNRSISMRGSIYLTFEQLANSVLQYLGFSRENADVDLFNNEIKIQGNKLQCTLQMLQMVQNPLILKAKVRYIGGG